jgi:hypothetical protein
MKTTLNELKNSLGIQDSVFEVERILKRICKVKYDTALTDDQWLATLEFIDGNYKYTAVAAMVARLRRRQTAQTL